MKTAADQLDRMDALVKRMAARGHAAEIDYTQAKEIIEERDDRFSKVLSAIYVARPGALEDSARRLARDILKALDA